METRWTRLDEILPLRQEVIIAGTDRESPYLPGDDEPSTRHAGVFENGACISCASFMRSEWEGRPAWQLRGMATAPAWQRQGIGRALLAFADAALRDEYGSAPMWCNARETAVGFYERLGWSVVSERFLTPGVAYHYRMVRHV